MKYLNCVSILAVLLFIIVKESHAQTWISLDGSKNEVSLSTEVIESDLNIHKVRMTLHGFHDNEITKNGTKYHQPYIEMYQWLKNEGEPQLPIIRQIIAIPEGADYKVSLKEEKWTDVEIGKIYPAQRRTKESDPKPEFYLNDSVYMQEVYRPSIVTMGTMQSWCYIKNIGICICPFKYYSQQGKLSVLTEFVLQIDFTGVSENSPVRLRDLKRATDWHLFDNNISGFPVRNETAKSSSSSEDYDYLIIVGDSLSIFNSQALQVFKTWKALKGYKTKVVSTATTGKATGSIKDYINQEYTNNDIKYVLFIGDQDKIPLKTISGIIPYETVKSDYWYGILNEDGSYQADIPIGRFSTDSLPEFQNMVQKTIAYEKSYDGCFDKTLLVAHKQDAPEKYQRCCENIRQSYDNFLTFRTAYGASTANGGNNTTNFQLIYYNINDFDGDINGGMHIVNYRGHGTEESWGFLDSDPELNGWNASNQIFDQTLSQLINTCSIYFDICCQNGNIEAEPCMMETFMRSPTGAVACIATTEDINTYSNDLYNHELYNKYLNDNVWHIGDINIQTHNELIGSDPEATYCALSYLCGGDPSLELWTNPPYAFSDISVTRSVDSIVVSSPAFVSGDIISVVSFNGELLHRIEMTGCSCSFPIPPSNFHIAVNRHNYLPWVKSYMFSEFIQNAEFNESATYVSTPLQIGYDVTTSVPYGNVVVKNGARLSILNGTGGVTIKNGFECENGAELVIE